VHDGASLVEALTGEVRRKPVEAAEDDQAKPWSPYQLNSQQEIPGRYRRSQGKSIV
jgi:hypothetical protein